MTRYALFLRGINVGGIRVGMSELRDVLTGIGAQEVRTWLNTGNAALDDDRDAVTLKLAVERAVSDAFQYDAHVIVRPAAQLADVVAAWPFGPSEGCHRYVVFGGATAFGEALTALAAGQSAQSATTVTARTTPGPVRSAADTGSPDVATEAVAVVGEDLMWRCPKGSSTTSPVGKVLGRKHFRALVTTRNLNTVEKML